MSDPVENLNTSPPPLPEGGVSIEPNKEFLSGLRTHWTKLTREASTQGGRVWKTIQNSVSKGGELARNRLPSREYLGQTARRGGTFAHEKWGKAQRSIAHGIDSAKAKIPSEEDMQHAASGITRVARENVGKAGEAWERSGSSWRIYEHQANYENTYQVFSELFHEAEGILGPSEKKEITPGIVQYMGYVGDDLAVVTVDLSSPFQNIMQIQLEGDPTRERPFSELLIDMPDPRRAGQGSIWIETKHSAPIGKPFGNEEIRYITEQTRIRPREFQKRGKSIETKVYEAYSSPFDYLSGFAGEAGVPPEVAVQKIDSMYEAHKLKNSILQIIRTVHSSPVAYEQYGKKSILQDVLAHPQDYGFEDGNDAENAFLYDQILKIQAEELMDREEGKFVYRKKFARRDERVIQEGEREETELLHFTDEEESYLHRRIKFERDSLETEALDPLTLDQLAIRYDDYKNSPGDPVVCRMSEEGNIRYTMTYQAYKDVVKRYEDEKGADSWAKADNFLRGQYVVLDKEKIGE